ncbi:MAG: GNAT family N-acetyltransferase [Candidatus Eisenbacteria bacterium]|uniref:GNAT family N-acetyltransferase n=1 Tax=Eiseniibacteriota bacterium TaxID=2212470 RepID=A0A933W162_UNCEI|nr:GNAT family N-acetyltransferase [Candidatus Eisenbacteria bacterium]
MITVCGAGGAVCATVEHAPLTPRHRGLRITWVEGETGVPSADTWYEVFARELADASTSGVRLLGTRLVTARSGDEAGLAPRRAACQREALQRLGFSPAEERLEYVLPLAEAIASLTAVARERRLAWRSVASVPGPELEAVAALLTRAAEGDPDHDPSDDALAMLLQRTKDAGALQSSECVQVGALDGRDAVVVLPSYRPATGVGSLFYLAVAPEARGNGLAAEALMHALVVLAAMGARTYHEGTAAANAPARRLLAHLAAEPTLTIEQWRFEIPID